MTATDANAMADLLDAAADTLERYPLTTGAYLRNAKGQPVEPKRWDSHQSRQQAIDQAASVCAVGAVAITAHHSDRWLDAFQPGSGHKPALRGSITDAAAKAARAAGMASPAPPCSVALASDTACRSHNSDRAKEIIQDWLRLTAAELRRQPNPET